MQEQQGRLQSALDMLQRALPYTADPLQQAHVLKEMGILCLRLDNVDGAAGFLERAVELDPSVTRGFSNLALALMKLHRHEDAALAFREASRFEPDNANARANLGTQPVLCCYGFSAVRQYWSIRVPFQS